VMPGATMEDAMRVADRIRRDVAAQPFPIMNGAEGLTITVSVGVAASDGVDDTPEGLLKRADEGVYEAKAHGRNQVIARAA
ncbi:MAG TPA: diguanylate cyclase, partial [Brevundimonas sp.]|nr:diguanylate cyclase [Brevundimonas sp.]